MVTTTAGFVPGRVLTTTEAREAAPQLAQRFHAEGVNAGIVFFGPHRRPDAAIVPAALLELLAPYLEDVVAAEVIRERRLHDTGDRLTLAQLDARHGIDSESVAAEMEFLRRSLTAPS
jgi:antitoxin StbD